MTTSAGSRLSATTRRTNLPNRVGAVRPSQILHTYGVGSLVDLPNFSVIVAGLQAWDEPRDEIIEPRLLAAVQAELGPQVSKLAAMPWLENTDNPLDEWARIGIPVLPFPRWLRCTGCGIVSTVDGGLFTLEPYPYRIDRTRYVHKNCNPRGKSPLAVPARFVMACRNGHLDEFPWQEFAHRYTPCPVGGGSLKIMESGTGTRSTEVLVQCTGCQQTNMIAAAFDARATEGPRCRGRHPHLRSFDPSCLEIAEPLLLGASNTWFGITRSALAIPVDATNPIDEDVEGAWNDLSDPAIQDEKSLEMALKFNPALRRFNGTPIGDLWSAVQRRRNPPDPAEGAEGRDLKSPEWDRFIDPNHAPVSNEFTIEDSGVPAGFAADIAQVIAAPRLRETAALIGFARIDPPDPGAEEVEVERRRVPLSTKSPSWVPANDTRGEGIFLRLPEERVRSWEDRVKSDPRMLDLHAAIVARYGEGAWLGSRYVFLHSLAHLIINELALECGYNAASLRERIYSDDGKKGADPMAGILIYTAAADSEGTLGGLVAMAKQTTFGRVLDAAVRNADLCSSDPLCAEHTPTLEDRTMHGAACHSCLFVPETSCERNNRLLDRATLVRTMSNSAMAYFARG